MTYQKCCATPITPVEFKGFVDSLDRGTTTDVRLLLGSAPCGQPVAAPVRIVKAPADGPTLFTMSGVHGDEPGAVLGMRLFLDGFSGGLDKGTLIACVVANVPAIEQRTRCNSFDGKDLVRIWPGKADGTVTETIAAGIAQVILDCADALVDLHCGTPELNENWVIYANEHSPVPGTTPEVEAKSLGIARAFGQEQILRTHPWKTTVSAFGSLGVPTIVAEVGGGLDWHFGRDQYLAAMANGLQGVLAHLDMVSGQPTPPTRQAVFDIVEEHHAAGGLGLWLPLVKAWDEVRAGDRLGVFINPTTGGRTYVTTQVEGTVMNPGCSWPVPLPGQWLMAIGQRLPRD